MAEEKYLGGAAISRLVEAAAAGVNVNLDSDPVFWDDEWSDKFHEWSAEDEGGCIILLFSDSPSTKARGIGGVNIFYQFAMSDSRPKAGAYFVGKAVTSNAWLIPNTSDDYQSACQMVEGLGLGDMPCVVLWGTGKKIAFLPVGISGDAVGVLIPQRTNASPMQDEVLSSHLTYVADEVLSMEDTRRKFWEDSAKFWPVKRAEREIQALLLIALRSAFRAYRFESETPVSAGDIDIRILPRDSSESGRVVIELKATKQFGSTGRAKSAEGELQWLLKGATQAQTYDVGAWAKYLCTFDMRRDRDDDIFQKAKKRCDEIGVKFRSYEIYASAEQLRVALSLKLQKNANTRSA